MKKFLLLLFAVAGYFVATAQQDSLVRFSAQAKKIKDHVYALEVTAQIQSGWHLYGINKNIEGLEPLKFSFGADNIKPVDEMAFDKAPAVINDAIFNNKTNVFTGNVLAKQQFQVLGTIPASIKISVAANLGKAGEFQQAEQQLEIKLEGGVENKAGQNIKIASINIDQPINDCGNAKTTEKSSGFLSVLLLGFAGGLIALLTPCVFPMIPVTVSFFTKRSSNRKKSVQNGLLYGFFILLIYTLASLPFHLLGNVQPEIFNNISTNAWLNILFFVVFIVFAISFFGYFEITLPGNIANKADSKSGLGSIGGIFFMALTLAIVSFSCTGPILGSLLVGSLSGGAWQLTAGLAGFGLALALPFALFAIFPNWLHSLPKSGGWLDTVKKILAFVEVALAFKFLSNADLVMHWGLIKREVFFAVWIITSLGLTLYLFGFLRLPHDMKGTKINAGRKILGVLALLFTLYLVPGITATKYANLKWLSGFPPPLNYSVYGKTNVIGKGLEANVINDYDAALALAKAQHKPLLLDFTGWACVNCRKMEENVWTDPEVYQFIKQNFVLVSLYVDDKQNLAADQRFTFKTKDGSNKDISTVGDKWATFQAENFNQVTQPLYIILNNKEQLVNTPTGYTADAKAYLKWLQCGKETFDKNN
jgi:thiol:disulfide interchange protein